MIAIPSDFRAAYPAFSDPIAYPDAQIAAWIAVSLIQLDPVRWGDFYYTGVGLYVAHNLLCDRMAARGAVGAGSSGVLAAKSVGGASVSYNTGLGLLEGAGAWNLTNYGVRYLQLARMMGMGGMQV